MKWHAAVRCLTLVTAIAGMGSSDGVFAQQRPGAATSASASASVSADQIRQRAAKIKEARTLLNDPEATVRMAAFDQYTASNDAVLQDLAYEVGFSSADGSMRALALKRRLMHMTTFTVDITEVGSDGRPSDRNAGPPQVDARSVTWHIVTADERSGVVLLASRAGTSEATARSSGANLTINGLNVTISANGMDPNCLGSMHLDESNVLVGQMKCQGIRLSNTFPAMLKIRATVT